VCADYDHSTIDVAPNDLKTKKDQLVTLAQQIADCLGRVNDTLSALQLEWRGQSAKEQQEVSAEWVRVFGELFGTKKNPEDGVLNALADHVANAAKNYAEVENKANEIFSNLLANMVKHDVHEATAERIAKGSPNPDQTYQEVIRQLEGDPPPLTDHKDPTKTAISTDYPNA
jgi:uncharacterized protein YukE